MGIPGLVNAIGIGERVSLAKVAGLHLERTARPIRIAVDISIWLFQVQASRGGKNPELRTLYYRLIKLLALPVHPLFVYDGRHKPPFKRGKAVSRNPGNLPIIQRSKDLIERFRFPWHEAPGEAEAECARLQQAGIVDAVISNDVDTLMFGSTFTMMNFSNESGSGASGATHVTCYHLNSHGHVSNVSLDRAGMILFAMLSGGDYLPSGVEKCGPGTAAEIAKAKFGEDLLQIIASHPPDLDSRLCEWRERLQYELDSNESGYFANKHPAVRIPENFPDPTILEYYAEPKVSTDEEMSALRHRLRHAWDREIDPLPIRSFTAENLDWKYRSGARKVIKNLAEPLVSYRLRRQRPVSGTPGGSLAPNCDAPWLQKVYKSRVSFGTDGMTEVQIDMLPIDVVGLDLMAEEPNPPQLSKETEPVEETTQVGAEDDAELAADGLQPTTPSKTRVTKRYDIFEVQKIWVLESVARLGLPAIVQKWENEQAEKAKKAAAPKKPSTRRTAPKKKGIIDPGMKRGSILKYGTLTKEKSELSASNKSYLLENASTKPQSALLRNLSSSSQVTDLEDDPFTPSMYSQQQTSDHVCSSSLEVDELIETFSSLTTRSQLLSVKRHSTADRLQRRSRAQAAAGGALESDEPIPTALKSILVQESSVSPSRQLRSSVPRFGRPMPEGEAAKKDRTAPSRKARQNISSASNKSDMSPHALKHTFDLDSLDKSIGLLSISGEDNYEEPDPPARSSRQPLLSKTKGDASRRPSQITTVNNARPAEQAVSQKDKPRTQYDSAIPSKQTRDEPATLSETHPRPNKTCSTSKACSKSITKREVQIINRTRTSGHIENITAIDGFWTVDSPSETKTGLLKSGTGQVSVEKDTQSGSNPRKKRLARVSIVDMIHYD
ncbi:Flap endonuclease [Penicillium rolfsii]|nr:Flap endonuclease [Penicillium rolfsii]